jgi:cytochrome c oxidase cbb3-type subunit 1
MAMVLWAAGLIQGILWIAQVPFLNTVWDIQPYWVIRTVAGAMMVLSFFVLLYNMWKTNKEAASID